MKTLAAFALVAAVAVSCASQSTTSPSSGAKPSVSQLTPTSGPVGSTATIKGTGFAATGNTVKFGGGYIKNLNSSDGATITFEVPAGLDLCAPNPTGPCPGAFPAVTPGDYAVAVMSGGTTSNAMTFTVVPRQ